MRVLALVLTFGIVVFLSSCTCKTCKTPAITIQLAPATPTDPVLDFAAAELEKFILPLPNSHPDQSCQITLEVDAALAPFSFGWEYLPTEKGHSLHLFGQNSTCVLHAVYSVLEKGGYLFELTGPVAPQQWDINLLVNTSNDIHPAVLRRGIRQHINFPMDISSYPLTEAQEYIRNLARMRFNYIMFHSYPNQWIEVTDPGYESKAGSFFYGQRHDIPDHALLKRVLRNQKTFCIPEIEPVFEDKTQRSHQAVAWLREVMSEAKRVGMEIEFSFEPRGKDLDLTKTLKTAQAILASYPQIDTLELITEETGGWGPIATADQIRQAITTFFDSSMLDDPAIARIIKDNQNDIGQLLTQLGHNIAAAKQLQSQWPDKPRLKLGVYCAIPKFLNASLVLMRKFTPAGIDWAILPAHSSSRVADYMQKVDFTAADWNRTLMISWIEFDGLMYLQQNDLEGIRRLIVDAQTDLAGRPINGILYNHWRNAECRTPARYAAVTALDGPIPTADFYRTYGQSLGIVNIEAFILAMHTLDAATQSATTDTPNIGFCFVGVWGQGIGLYGNWKYDKVVAVRQQYEKSIQALQTAARGTTAKSAQDYLTFLENRIRTTILYLKGVEKGTELQTIIGQTKPSELTNEQKQQVIKTCNMGLEFMEQFMSIYAQQLPDRGVEGNLISFYYTPMAILKRIRHEYGGVAETIPAPPGLVDAPPPPITFD